AGDVRIELAALGHLAAVEYSLGELESARGYWKRALELAQGRNSRRQAEILAHLGRLGARLGETGWQGQLERARELLGDRGSLEERARASYLEGEAWLAAGSVQGNAGAPTWALGAFGRASELWRRSGDALGQVLAATGEGRAHRDRGELVQAAARLRAAVAGIESLRLEMANPATRAMFSASRHRAYELLIDTLIDLHTAYPEAGHGAEALRTSERARGRRILESILARGEPGAAPERDELAERRRRLAGRLGLLVRRQALVSSGRSKGIEGEDLGAAIADARAELDLLEARIRRQNPRRGSLESPPVPTVAEMQRQLEEGTVMLHYALGRERGHLWVVRRSGWRHFPLAAEGEVSRAARRLHQAWGTVGGDLEEDRRAAIDASRILLGPAGGELRGERLVILADDALHYVPFGALPWPAPDGSGEARPLVERFEVIRIPSAAVLAAQRRLGEGDPGPGGGPRMTVLADPVFHLRDPRVAGVSDAVPGAPRLASVRGATGPSGGFGRLPGTGAEARAIAAFLPADRVRVLLGFEASRDALEEGLRDTSILHLATHGRIDTEHPELSGLMLSQLDAAGRRRADAFLDLHEVRQLRLDRAELVVLSGCRTALGRELRGEAFQGLANAFLLAGASRVMASLWPIADRANVELMSRFYRQLLEEGASPPAALRRAQIEMAQERRFADPYYWAGFVVQGDWR
ncbi:MAG: CHAT domain-containing protein, partial [Holophagales bacterium]|nr:CHAT domain-containing protein [Holophagales bacterium]